MLLVSLWVSLLVFVGIPSFVTLGFVGVTGIFVVVVVIPSFVTFVLILPEVWFSTIGFFIVVVGNSCFVTLGFVGVVGIFVVFLLL